MTEAADGGVLPNEPAPSGRWERLIAGRPWLRRMVRSIGFSLAALVALAIVLFIRVRGELHQSLGPLGPQLAQSGLLDELLARDQPVSADEGRALVINGQRFELSTTSVDVPLEEALAGFMADCPTSAQMGEPVVTERHGYAICARAPEGSDADLAERLEAFSESSDIGQLGRIEYAYAVAGASGKTSMLRLASTNRLEMDELVPLGGRDALGDDPSDFPRPPDGARVLHSFEEGLPYAIYVYGRSERSPDELRQWYRQNVDPAVWVELDLEAAAASHDGEVRHPGSITFARREDLTRFIVVELRERPANELRPGKTMIALAEAR